MLLKPASELTIEPIQWLWPGYLAEGALAILDGDPGLGKSLFTLDLAARLTSGRDWPNGATNRAPASVILLGSEDPEPLVRSRLVALGADMPRTFPWPRTGEPGLPQLPSDIATLEQAVLETHAKLIIVDPIVAFLDRGVAMCSDASVRRGLNPLAGLAERHRAAILMVRHLNKDSKAPALYRGGSSIAFIAACRTAWLVGRDPRMEERMVLAQQKNNIVGPQPSLCYQLPADAPRIDWQGVSPWTAEELTRHRSSPQRRRARDFLRLFLEKGPRPFKEILAAAGDAGLSEGTLRRARKDLGIRWQQCYEDGKRNDYWLLPGQEVPADPKSETPELDDWLRRWRELYPQRTDDDERAAYQ